MKSKENLINERIIKILYAIIKHCNIINDTMNYFGRQYSEFEDNSIYQNAILTPVTQIGELVKKIPMEFRNEYNEIPWRNIAGMRDIVVHNYETIDKLILWNVVIDEIDSLKQFCKKIIDEGD